MRHVEGGQHLQEEVTRGGRDSTDVLAGRVREDLGQDDVVHLHQVEHADLLHDGSAPQVVAVGDGHVDRVAAGDGPAAVAGPAFEAKRGNDIERSWRVSDG